MVAVFAPLLQDFGMTEALVIVWFRHDLRLSDHAALTAAVATGAPVVPLYVLDDDAPVAWTPGGASRWWLHKSLEKLAQSIDGIGGSLILRRGDTADVLAKVVAESGASAVYCSRSYEPWARDLEIRVRDRLHGVGVQLKRFPGALLHEPDRLKTQAGGSFKVYSPFWRALSASFAAGTPLPAPSKIAGPDKPVMSEVLSSWELLPTKPDWAGGLRAVWQPGEESARQRLDLFLRTGLHSYAEDRNRPDLPRTSRLSPHLHFGEISPRQCWHAANLYAGSPGVRGLDKGLETFLKEVVWREFSYHLLFHFPELPETPFRSEFGQFPWRDDEVLLKAWQRGLTGYPIVDAGMRELWATGWMHNRVRMIAASFVIKDLLISWQRGEAWFWDTLVDADLASNAASWQWVAGSGADAAPYFRIFNPVSQGQKFDPEGTYVRRWVPELSRLPASVIHEPWTAPALVLEAAGVRLGDTYPLPIVDHALQRQAALAGYEQIKIKAKAS